MNINKKNKVEIDVKDPSSFTLDKNNMPDLILLKKNTSSRTTMLGDRFTATEKKDVIIAAFSLKDGKTIFHSVVYEPVHMKDIKETFNKIVEINNLEVLDNATLTTATQNIARSSLGNGAYKAAKISDYKER